MKRTAFNRSMKYVMNLAWNMVKKNNMTMSEALKLAWCNYNLRNKLHQSKEVSFVFKKRNGEIRVAHGSLAPSIIGVNDESTIGFVKKTPFGNQAYYDLDKNDWRSFRCAELLSSHR